ncbi:MAG: hypothetical protein RBR15_07360 [Sphaerochaeta sp.]|nr:hypothetical protein [Sphaerochaeta sp.]
MSIGKGRAGRVINTYPFIWQSMHMALCDAPSHPYPLSVHLLAIVAKKSLFAYHRGTTADPDTRGDPPIPIVKEDKSYEIHPFL